MTVEKRKILIPVTQPKEIKRPVPQIQPLDHTPFEMKFTSSPDSNPLSSDSKISFGQTEQGTMEQNENYNALRDAIDRALTQQSEPDQIIPVAEEENKSITSDEVPTTDSGRGTRFFRFPQTKMEVGRTNHVLKWAPTGSGNFELLPTTGAPEDYIRHCGWHLHGASLWMGTSATGVTDRVGVDPAAGVTGFIPQATKHIAELVQTSRRFSENRGLDGDGNEYQFGVIAVLGGQDHAALHRQINDLNMNSSFAAAFRAIGVPNASFRAALYNDMGQLFALEVKLGNPERFGRGRHLIFIHPANDVGGGKSDESLIEGRLASQCASLANEFVWWQAALERVGGKIGAIESTLGGTARIGRYALLSARTPRTMFATDAFEVINIDRADWIQENLQSQLQEYRANFATTLLRTVWGKVGERLRGFPVLLSDRSDKSTQQVNKVRAQIAMLRNLFLGHPELDLLQGDISDERIATRREEAITHSQYMKIHDTVEKNPKGPWEQQRRVRLNTTLRVSQAKMMSLAKAEDPTQNTDYAEEIVTKMRGLATSNEKALPPGGFVVVNAMVPSSLLRDTSNKFTAMTIGRAIEAIARGLNAAGIDKPLVNLYQVPTGVGQDIDEITVQITEDQTGTNVLIVSTEEVEPSKKRMIVSNPDLKAISNPYGLVVSAFNRLLDRMVDAHHGSGYHHCISDGDLMRAFFRHYYGSSFANRPNLLLGGSNRQRNKTDTKGE